MELVQIYCKILKTLNERAPLTVRANLIKCSREELKSILFKKENAKLFKDNKGRMVSTELNISAVIGFKGKKAFEMGRGCPNSFLLFRHCKWGFDFASGQRAHHLPSWHHHRGQTHN